jgi:enoyl-CoA hydratase
MGTEHLLVERVGHTLVITMNRPEAKNALSQSMLVGMADAWQELNEDDDLRCAVLTGSGGSFCTGMDLKAAAKSGSEAGGVAEPNPYAARWAEDPDIHWKALLRHYRLRKPLIAAVEGHAVAGGTEILQATHIRVAGESATFGIFEARRGLFPVGGSTVRLQRQIGYTNAMEMLLTARGYTASEALQLGLIGHVVPDGQALAKALDLAALVCGNGPLAVEAILRSVQETASLPEKEALALEFEIGWPIFATNDAKEGPRAFAEKRAPDWTRT